MNKNVFLLNAGLINESLGSIFLMKLVKQSTDGYICLGSKILNSIFEWELNLVVFMGIVDCIECDGEWSGDKSGNL